MQIKAAPKEDPSVQLRLYELNNEIRNIRGQLDAALLDLARADSDAKAARSDKALLDAELQKRQKRMEGLEAAVRALESTQAENSELKYQL